MNETFDLLIEQYGLFALFVGAMFEGEPAALVAGFLAHQGTFPAWAVGVVIFAGTCFADIAYFLAGRYLSHRAWVARIMQRPGFARARRLMHEHPVSFVVLRRFAYGVRPLTGLACGLSEMRVATFVTLTLMVAAVWSAIFCALGYFFGVGVETAIGAALEKHQTLILTVAAALVGLLIAVLVIRRLSRRHVDGAINQ
ncbi:MAG: DedA family protein [Rhizobiaceae bacterium]